MSDDDKTRISTNDIYTGVGTQLSGIYELDERIASGGMGEVYRGHNIQTGDHVAIKIVLPEFARDQTILSLFRKEASILNHLSHDAVVRYHVFTIDPRIGRPYLAMEFVDGQSLFDVMRRGPMRGKKCGGFATAWHRGSPRCTRRARFTATSRRTTSSCLAGGWKAPRSSISASPGPPP